ncbi:MAG: protein translocase subunit SecF [Sphingomonadales bacterium]|nr:protein translocase subunit SecF [Sphingomonadales bacterium]
MLLKLAPSETKIPFIKMRFAALGLSITLIIASMGIFFTKGLNLGIDFEGGIMMEVQTDGPADLRVFRGVLESMDLGDVAVQTFGAPDDVMIRIERQEGDSTAQQAVVERVEEKLSEVVEGLSYRRVEFVGPKVSGEMVVTVVEAVLISVLAVLVYIWFRFEWHFGFGAVIALLHDVILTIGFFSLTGLEFNLSIIAAILTIVGYSLNDTVVVYDRVREKLRKYSKMELPDLLDLALNKTLNRTLMTSITTLIALFSLFFLGGDVIAGFTAAMIWGVFVGTYSSVFIAAPVLLYLNLNRDDMMISDSGNDAENQGG